MQGTALTLSVVTAAILILGAASSASAAQLEIRINPDHDSSMFKIRYQKTIFIEYADGGTVADSLRGDRWSVTASAAPGSAASAAIADKINQNLVGDGSQAQVSGLNVEYLATLKGNPLSAAVDYQVLITGDLGGYTIRAADGQNPALIDMGWRGISIDGPVSIDGVEINMPLSAIRSEDPQLASLIAGSEAETLLSTALVDADFIRDQPMTNWHFLFDPTGINADASQFGLNQDIAGFVVSSYTMGESSIREGIQIEREFDATFVADKTYVVRTVQSADSANVDAIGFSQLDRLDDIEILGVLATPPEGYAQTSTGDFPVAIVYGMAGMAAVGGGAFFIFSSRKMKQEEKNQGQTGIDPSRLVGYQTSSSAGGYQTNRGEAQLRDDAEYMQTRNVYDDAQTPPPPPAQNAPPPPGQDGAEAACGCAASAEMGSECDCQMQGSCLCDADCRCAASVCKEHVASF